MVITLHSSEGSCSYTNLPSLMVCYDISSNCLARTKVVTIMLRIRVFTDLT